MRPSARCAVGNASEGLATAQKYPRLYEDSFLNLIIGSMNSFVANLNVTVSGFSNSEQIERLFCSEKRISTLANSLLFFL